LTLTKIGHFSKVSKLLQMRFNDIGYFVEHL